MERQKKVYEERELSKKQFPRQPNKWAVTIFGEWQISWSVIAVLDPGGLFKGYD